MYPVKVFKVGVSIISFCVFLALMTIVNEVAWEYTAADLYDCTDPMHFGYLEPGHWVHPWGDRPVAVVHRIVHGRSMSEPDTIKEGWSVSRLWYLWCAFVVFSIFVSLIFAALPWLTRAQILKRQKGD